MVTADIQFSLHDWCTILGWVEWSSGERGNPGVKRWDVVDWLCLIISSTVAVCDWYILILAVVVNDWRISTSSPGEDQQ